MKQLIAIFGTAASLLGSILIYKSSTNIAALTFGLLFYITPFIALIVYYLLKLACMYKKLSLFLVSRINLLSASFSVIILFLIQFYDKLYLNDFVFNLFVFALSWVWSSWCLVAENYFISRKNHSNEQL